MFTFIGVLLTVCGVITGSNGEMYQRSLNININLSWGLVLLLFGVFMLIMAWRGGKKLGAPQAKDSEPKPEELASRR